MKSDAINGIAARHNVPIVREVATGAYYPVATTGPYYAQNGELESQNL